MASSHVREGENYGNIFGFLKVSQVYLNLVSARPSHAERVRLRLYSFMEDFASAQVSYSMRPLFEHVHVFHEK